MKLYYKLAAAAVAMVASTTAAQAQTDIDEWTIFSNPGQGANCRALSTYAKGLTVSITLHTDGQASMMFIDSAIFSAVRDNVAFDGQLVFVKGEDLETKWSDLELTGAVLGDDKSIKGAYLQTPSGADLLTTIGTSDIFGLLQGEDVLLSIKPDNPAALAKGLRACVAKL